MIDEVLRQRREAEASALAGQALAANGPVMPVLDAPVVNTEDPAVKTTPLRVDSSLPVMAPAGGAPLSRVHAGIGAPLERVQAPTGKASVYGAFAYDPDAELNKSINELLQEQVKATEKRRTDAAKLAQIAALGNVLQTAFAPVGWIGQRGATSQVANPDSRQYITAFNEALKAQQDLANVGVNAAKMRLDLANRRAERAYQAQQRRDDREFSAKLQRQNMEFQAENQRKNMEFQAEMQKQVRKDSAELQKELANLKFEQSKELARIQAGNSMALYDRQSQNRINEINQRYANMYDQTVAKAFAKLKEKDPKTYGNMSYSDFRALFPADGSVSQEIPGVSPTGLNIPGVSPTE